MTAAFTAPAILAAALLSPFMIPAAPAAAAAAACYSFGDWVTMTGTYEAGTGAQGLLFLEPSICVDADAVSAGVAGADSIQIHCPLIEAASGSIVELTGRLMGAHTGNGRTPILLACAS